MNTAQRARLKAHTRWCFEKFLEAANRDLRQRVSAVMFGVLTDLSAPDSEDRRQVEIQANLLPQLIPALLLRSAGASCATAHDLLIVDRQRPVFEQWLLQKIVDIETNRQLVPAASAGYVESGLFDLAIIASVSPLRSASRVISTRLSPEESLSLVTTTVTRINTPTRLTKQLAIAAAAPEEQTA